MVQLIGKALDRAVGAGFYPVISRRGDVWRVHLSAATNTWEDVKTLDDAATWLTERVTRAAKGEVFP